jgi:hypothetical protein
MKNDYVFKSRDMLGHTGVHRSVPGLVQSRRREREA